MSDVPSYGIMVEKEGLALDDVLLQPKYSTVSSRSSIDLSVKIKNISFNHPLVPANMKTVTGLEMAKAAFRNKGLSIIHRFCTLDEQLKIADDIYRIDPVAMDYVGFSVGIKPQDKNSVECFHSRGVNIICVDVAHANNKYCFEMIEWIKLNYPNILIIAGTIATADGATRLWRAGADIVRINIGAGSTCSTRINTGNGVPQLTAIIDVAEAKKDFEAKNKNRKVYTMTDGGCKSNGDLVKCLTLTDLVMTGNMFAGCHESNGKKVNINGKIYKEYAGSSTYKNKHVEGVVGLIPLKGKFDTVLEKMLDDIRSGCSYQGAHNLLELRQNPVFIKITNAGLKESHPHDVILG